MKKPMESWGNFADDLCVLVDRTYLELQEESREYITLNCYLEQLRDPRISFEVRQRLPKNVFQVVAATLELELCLFSIFASCHGQHNNEVSGQSADESNIFATERMTVMLEELRVKLEKLEYKVTESEKSYKQKGQLYYQQTQKQPQVEVICHKCNQSGHYAHGRASAVTARLQAKDEVLLPMDQVCYNDDDSMLNNDAPTIAINNVSKYSVCANIFGSRVSFLIDTGAAVSIVSSEVWDHIKPTNSPRLNHLNVKLVGVDDAPLQIQGSVTVELEMSRQVLLKNLL